MTHDGPQLSAAWRTAGLSGVARALTVDAWAAIDADHRDADPRVGLREAGLVVIAALVLTAQRYGGTSAVYAALTGAPAAAGTLEPTLFWVWTTTLTYTLPPMLYAWWAWGEGPARHGLRLGGATPWGLYAALFVAVLPFVGLAAADAAFVERYPLADDAGRSWEALAVWELSYAVQFVALEYFFRGVLLFPLARRLGAGAVLLSLLPYVMLHFAKPLPETLGAIVAGLVLGTLALRTRSIVGGAVVHVAVAWTMDGLALAGDGTLARLVGR